jgi:hypothetical protein
MDYKKIYNSLMDRAVDRELDYYYELHHIIPKCMGGSNESDNIVKLTFREHFIAHWILHRIYPNNKLIAYAFSAMKMDKYGNRISEEWAPSSRQLEELKLAYIQGRKGSKHTEETRMKISNSLKGKECWNKGKTVSDDSKQKMSEAKLGWNRTEEDKIKISEGKKNWYKNNEHPNKGKTYKLSTKWDRSKDGVENRIEQVKKLYESGTPITQITNEVNVTRQAIYNWIKEYNWSRY